MGRTLQIEHARAYLPLLRPARYKGLHGGRGSAKSHEFAKLAIERCMAWARTRIVCVREIQKDLEQSVKRLIEDKLNEYHLGMHDGFRILDTHIETPGDGIIIFKGMQSYNSDSIKSLEGYDVAWVEEAQTISERSLTMLRPTIRKDPDPITGRPGSEIWLSWNPRSAKDPVDVMLRGPHPYPDAIVIGTTFRDNPWFPDVLRKEMEWDREKDLDKYNHIWLGGYEKHTEARVFKNWRIEEFTAPVGTAFKTGADWGFSVDPSTLVRGFESLTDWNTGLAWPRKRLYIDYDLYQIGVEIDHLPSFYDGMICGCPINQAQALTPHVMIVPDFCRDREKHGMMRQWPIIADSARPETISYMRRHGYGRMEAATKGPNSIKEGVIFLQGYDIIIHPRCTHAVDEFTNYLYKTEEVVDPITGMLVERPLPILIDKKNHIIDPVRYAVEQLRGAMVIRKTAWG